MIGLDDFRDRMRIEAEKTKKTRSVQVAGRDLDDALSQASLELSLPIKILEYEILDRGRSGFMGLGGSPCRIIAYESRSGATVEKDHSLEDSLDLMSYEEDDVPQSADVNGRCSVRLGSGEVWMKVFPPVGEGVPITVEDAVSRVQERGIAAMDENLIATAVANQDRMWINVGNFPHNPSNNAIMSLEVAEGGMRAFIRAQTPELGGSDITAEEIRGFLENNSVVYGIAEEALQEFEDFPIYDAPYLVAEGVSPVHGADARVIYNFETEPDKIHLHERDDGSVDFKELNKFQNVVKGQPLARKIAPEPGKDGRTIHGRYIPATDGRDIEIGLGKNVTITDQGATVVATASGHVMLKNGKITVETVLLIPGNVDAKTGNVNTLGSVEIKGNVEDGYSVTAQGKIDVAGYVGKANLNAGGDIIVSRGINGGESDEFGHIVAGKTIWSSFIQNAQADAGEYVIVSAGIVNSDVVSQKKILCKGRRARIVGGHVRASEEVNAVILGSAGGLETLVEVGFDPKIREELEQLEKQRDAIEIERDMVDRNLQGLKKQVRMQRKRLSKEKEKLFDELRLKHNSLHKKLQTAENEIQKRHDYLESLQMQGRISASRKVLAGVTLRIRDVEYIVKDSYESAVTFILEDEFIKTVKYQDIEEDLTRR